MNFSNAPTIPDRLPVMMLPDCNLFPHGLLPLHIFEPRYRQMLVDILESDRMFCIGTLVAPENPFSPEKCVHPASAAAFVRACVAEADGCSNLLLQGMQRIRLSHFQTDQVYVTAAVEVVETTSPDAADLAGIVETIRRQALMLIEGGQAVAAHVQGYLLDLMDAEVLGDLVAFHFVRNPAERHPLLEMTCLASRLQALSRALKDRLSGQTTDEES